MFMSTFNGIGRQMQRSHTARAYVSFTCPRGTLKVLGNVSTTQKAERSGAGVR